MKRMEEIRKKRLLLRPFRESDWPDLYECLFQLENDEFEGYPGVTWENAGLTREAHLKSNMYFHTDKDGNPIWKDTYIYATLGMS